MLYAWTVWVAWGRGSSAVGGGGGIWSGMKSGGGGGYGGGGTVAFVSAVVPALADALVGCVVGMGGVGSLVVG